MKGITLQAMYRYPVKSLRGAAFEGLEVGDKGFLFDREWMVVDAQGRFLTQRQQPRMCLVDTDLSADGALRLQAPGMPELQVRDDHGEAVQVTVWHDSVGARRVDPLADAWLSEFLQQACRLVRFPAGGSRAVDADYAAQGDQVGFADGFPFLLISQASLDDLNGRLDQAVEMLRFRPNLVVQGCTPYAEDEWRRIRIGDLTFRVVKPCSRCIIPTIDPATAERAAEPLRTLMSYRKRDNRIYFGQNLIQDSEGELRVGMPVEVLE